MKLSRLALLWVPILVWCLGFTMNAVVLYRNNNQMPVYIPGGCDERIFEGENIMSPYPIHTCMTPKTKWKILCDWIVIRYLGIASPGDFLEWFGELFGYPFAAIFLGLYLNDRSYFGA